MLFAKHFNGHVHVFMKANIMDMRISKILRKGKVPHCFVRVAVQCSSVDGRLISGDFCIYLGDSVMDTVKLSMVP